MIFDEYVARMHAPSVSLFRRRRRRFSIYRKNWARRSIFLQFLGQLSRGLRKNGASPSDDQTFPILKNPRTVPGSVKRTVYV